MPRLTLLQSPPKPTRRTSRARSTEERHSASKGTGRACREPGKTVQPRARTGDSGDLSRLQALLVQEIAFIDNPEFRAPQADQFLLPLADSPATTAPRQTAAPAGTPSYLAQLYATPLLTAAQEVDLFRRMNYLKFRANTLRAELNPRRPKWSVVNQIESLLARAADVRREIIVANLRLVVSLARRFADEHNDFDELVSDGNLTLVNAVEKFDYSRGFRFSTYATHSIQRDFFRQIRRRRQDRTRFVPGADIMVATVPDAAPDELSLSDRLEGNKQLSQWMARELDERERSVLTWRFGLDRDAGPQTLQEIGQRLGVSKERVRQLEIRALETLQRTYGRQAR
ncbi:MAG: sigma-70 family RNA polymerase sigma factor [Planctomycetales bacterium]